MDDAPLRYRRACGGSSLSQGGLYAIFANVFCRCAVDYGRGSDHIALREFGGETLPDDPQLQPASPSGQHRIHQPIRDAD